MNKKALSGLISNMLMIALAISALFTLSLAVRKTVSLSPQVDCFELRLNSISIEKVCQGQEYVELSLSRKFNTNLEFVEVIVSNSSASVYRIGEGCINTDLPSEGETKLYLLPERASQVSIKIGECVLESKQILPCG